MGHRTSTEVPPAHYGIRLGIESYIGTHTVRVLTPKTLLSRILPSTCLLCISTSVTWSFVRTPERISVRRLLDIGKSDTG